MGNIRASVPVYKHHPGTLYQQELLPPPRQQIKGLYRLREPKPHLLHPSGSLHQQGRHKYPPQKMNHADSWARISQITIENVNWLVLQQVRARRQKIQPLRPHLILDHLQDHQPVQEMTSHQEIWVLADLQFSVQHVANIHTGEGNAHMTIIVQHVKIMTMLHTCVGLTDKPATTKVNKAREVCRYASTVEASNTVHLTAKGDLGTIGNNHMIHLNPWGETNRLILMFQVEQHLWEPTLNTMANLHNITETTTTGSHRGSLRQGSMKDTTRGTHLLHSHQHPH